PLLVEREELASLSVTGPSKHYHSFTLHFSPSLPGDLRDTGYGRGKHYSLDVPLHDGIDDDSYLSLFKPLISKVMHIFQPGAVVLQLEAQCGAVRWSSVLCPSQFTLFPSRLLPACSHTPGDLRDTGYGRGKHYSLNVPLHDGIDDDSYLSLFKPLITKVMDVFQPGAVVLQCGADSLSGDRLGCFNLSVRGHSECVRFLRSFNVPLLLLGGGGYTIRNVARCWCYETGVAVGLELEDRMPFNDYYEYFGPDYTLHITPSNMENQNSRAYLDSVREAVLPIPTPLRCSTNPLPLLSPPLRAFSFLRSLQSSPTARPPVKPKVETSLKAEPAASLPVRPLILNKPPPSPFLFPPPPPPVAPPLLTHPSSPRWSLHSKQSLPPCLWPHPPLLHAPRCFCSLQSPPHCAPTRQAQGGDFTQSKACLPACVPNPPLLPPVAPPLHARPTSPSPLPLPFSSPLLRSSRPPTARPPVKPKVESSLKAEPASTPARAAAPADKKEDSIHGSSPSTRGLTPGEAAAGGAGEKGSEKGSGSGFSRKASPYRQGSLAAPYAPPSSGRRAVEPPSSSSSPGAVQPDSRAARPPSRRAAQSPSRPAAEPPSRRAAEPPCSRAAQQLRSSTAAPPSSRVIEQPLFLPPRPGPTYLDCVLTFDAEGRAVDFEVWVDDFQQFLQCDRADGLSLFDLTSGASPAPPATADSTVRSQWAIRDAAARLAVRRHLPTTERAHFSQYRSAETLYDAVVARYSSPATAALSRLFLPYLFPDLSAFPTVTDLITHLRTSDTRYRAALPAEDHFLSVCPTSLTVDLLEERLLAAEQSIVAVGASRGDPRTPVFQGCSPPPLVPSSVASAAAADLGGFESVGAASAPSGRRRPGKGKRGRGAGGASGGGGGSGGGGSGGGGSGGGRGGEGGGFGSSGGGGGGGGGGGSGGGGGGSDGAGRGSTPRSGSGGGPRPEQQRSRETPSSQQLRDWYAGRQRGGGAGPCTYVLRTGDRAGEQCGGLHSTQRCFGRLTDSWRHQFPGATEIPRWGDLSRAGVAIFDLDFDAILAAMYALSTSDEGDCYLCLPPDLGGGAAALGACEAAALGASASAAPGAGESALSGTASAQVFHTFTLDLGASRSFFRDRTTLTPLSRPVAVSLADPSGGPVLASFSTVLPCPAAPSGTLSGLYLPSFSTNLVSGADLQDQGVDQFTPASQRVTQCTCARTGRHLATFTRRPGSSLYTLSTASPPVPPSGQVAASSQVLATTSGPGMASRVLVSGLPRSLPPLPSGPTPICVPCVEGRQRAAPHSSAFPPTEAPLQTLHMDVWGPARVRGQGHERYFLLVVDDYSRYTTVFPLRSKGDVTEVLIDWIRAARLQLRESFGSNFPVLRLHSDRGGEFSSARLGAFCRARGIHQTFTLPASPKQNGIAERRIGMVMDVARTSMIDAAAPHFLWPFAVQYAAHQLNLQPRVSVPETSPTLRWTGKVGDASVFRVWGSRAFVRDLSTDKLSPRAVPC
ncbi:unnamed protein product, partial [Closterium sp. NIES-54]